MEPVLVPCFGDKNHGGQVAGQLTGSVLLRSGGNGQVDLGRHIPCIDGGFLVEGVKFAETVLIWGVWR